MTSLNLPLLLCLCLCGCYTPNQERFEADVRANVEAGMPLSSAVAKLASSGFACDAGSPVACARTRQLLLPSTCIEHVRLKVNPGKDIVRDVEIPPIACAGF